ncbi:FG-GAP-like repeat-containing protein, partial [Magnetococcales bacterium HHB-1]
MISPKPDSAFLELSPPVVTIASHQEGKLLIPGDNMLLNAAFKRQGDDLLLSPENHHYASVLVKGYFSTNAPPDLITTTGAQITADLAIRLAGPIAPNVYAGPNFSADAIGKISSLNGSAVIDRSSGQKVTVTKDTPLHEGDIIRTADNSQVGMIFADDSTFSLGSNGRMVVEKLEFDPSAQTGVLNHNVVQGAFSFHSGQIAKFAPNAMTVKTPVVTIGIRGTSVAGKAAAEGEENTIILLQSPDKHTGSITVTNSAGTQEITTAYQQIKVSSYTQQPLPPIQLSKAAADKLYQNVTQILPVTKYQTSVKKQQENNPSNEGDQNSNNDESNPENSDQQDNESDRNESEQDEEENSENIEDNVQETPPEEGNIEENTEENAEENAKQQDPEENTSEEKPEEKPKPKKEDLPAETSELNTETDQPSENDRLNPDNKNLDHNPEANLDENSQDRNDKPEIIAPDDAQTDTPTENPSDGTRKNLPGDGDLSGPTDNNSVLNEETNTSPSLFTSNDTPENPTTSPDTNASDNPTPNNDSDNNSENDPPTINNVLSNHTPWTTQNNPFTSNNTAQRNLQEQARVIEHNKNILSIRDIQQGRPQNSNDNDDINQIINTQQQSEQNHPPTLSDITIQGSEDQKIQFNADDFSDYFTDPEGKPLDSIKVLSLPSAGKLYLIDQPVEVGEEILFEKLDQLNFIPDSNSNGTFNFTWNGSDGEAYATEKRTISLHITSINDAPTITANVNLAAISEDNQNPLGETVSSLLGGLFKDEDNNSSLAGILITNNEATSNEGRWQYRSDDGTDWVDINSDLDIDSAQAIDKESSIRFLPTENYNGTPPSLDILPIDNSYTGQWSNDNSAILIDGSIRGGTTPFGEIPVTLGTVINAVNDAPTITDNVNLAAILEDNENPLGETVSSLLSNLFTDVDNNSSLTGILIVNNEATSTEGRWQYRSNDGTDWVDINSDLDIDSAQAIDKESSIRFLPTENYNGTPPSLDILPIDNSYTGQWSNNNSAILIDGSLHGGTTPFGEIPVTLNTVINAVNDAPTITDNVNLAAILEDSMDPSGETISSLLGNLVTDVDNNSSLSGLLITNNEATPDEGRWQYRSDDNTRWVDINDTLSFQSAQLLSKESQVRFVPSPDYNGTPGPLAIHAVDNNYNGTWSESENNTPVYIDSSNRGDSSPFSLDSVTLGISVTAVADPPSITQSNTVTMVAQESDLGNSSSRAIALEDLNGDNQIDAFIANNPEGNTVWLSNNQNTLIDSGQSLGNSDSRGLALGDIDGNNTIDAIIANYNAGNKIWLNDGQGQFSDNNTQTLGNADSNRIALADLDNDDDLDLFVANNDSDNTLWLNDGQGQFTLSAQNFSNSLNSTDIALADLDGDDYIDAVISNDNGSNQVWINNGDATFTLKGQLTSDYQNSTAVVLEDFDHDGDIDLFIANNDQPNEIWLNDGQGELTNSNQSIGNAPSLSATSTDIDGDGDQDLLVANATGTTNQIWLNDGQANFTDSNTLPDGNSNDIATADINGDGAQDIAIINYNAPSHIYLNYNDHFIENGPSVHFGTFIENLNVDDGDQLQSATIKIDNNLVVDEDQITVTLGGNITGNYDSNQGELILSGNDSVSNYLSVLQSLHYNNQSESPTEIPRTLSITINAGDTLTSTATDIIIAISGINDAPNLTDDTTLTAIEANTTSPPGEKIANLFNGLFEDADHAQINQPSGLAIVGNNATDQGAWQFSSDEGVNWSNIGGVADDATALALSASSLLRFLPVTDFSGAVPALSVRALDDTYTSGWSTNNSGTINLINVDTTNNGGSSALSAATRSITTSITALDPSTNPTTLSSTGSPSTLQHVEDGAATNVATNLTITSVTSIESAQVVITSGHLSGEDYLRFTPTTNITGNFDESTGVLTLSGTDTKSNYQTLLRSITYENTNTTTPSLNTRTLQFSVTDDTGLKATFSQDIDLNSTNDAPTLNGDALLTAIDEDDSDPPGETIQTLFHALFYDPDLNSAQITGVAIIENPSDRNSTGVWQYSANNGEDWRDIGTVNDTDSALVLSSTTQLRFIPTADYNSTVPALRVRALDSTYNSGRWTDNTNKIYLDVSNNGAETAISATTASVNITINPINDAPQMSRTNLAIDLDSNGNIDTAGIKISDLFQESFQDIDTDASLGGIAVLDNPATRLNMGSWQYSYDGQTNNWTDIGVISDDRNAVAISADSYLRFSPTDNNDAGRITPLTVRVIDNTYQNSWSDSSNKIYIDHHIHGGTTAISTNTGHLSYLSGETVYATSTTLTGNSGTIPNTALNLNDNLLTIDGRGSVGTSNQTFEAGLINLGTIQLASDHGSYQANLTVATDKNLTNFGSIQLSGSTSGLNTITGTIINQGTILVDVDDLNISNSQFNNRDGILNIHAGRTLDIQGGTTLFGSNTRLESEGTLKLSGTHTLDIGSGYNHNSQDTDLYFSGAVTIDGSGDFTNTGLLRLRTTNDQFNTTIINNDSAHLIIDGRGYIGTSTQNFNSGLVNQGILELASDHGSYSANIILETGQTLNNSGKIITSGSTSGTNNISGTLINSGVIHVGVDDLTINNDTTQFNNSSGTLNIATGRTLTINSGTTAFSPNTVLYGDGTINLSGTHILDIGDNGYNHSTHAVDLAFTGDVNINGTGTFTNDGDIRLRTTNDQFNTAVINSAIGNMTIDGRGAVGTSTQTFNEGLVNEGRLILASDHGSYSANINIATNKTLTNNGMITLTGSTSGSNKIAGSLDNLGIIYVNVDDLTVENTFFDTSSGKLLIDAGRTLNINGGTTKFTDQTKLLGAGSLDLTSTHTLDIDSGYNHTSTTTDLKFGGTVTVTGTGDFNNYGQLDLKTTNDQFDVAFHNQEDGHLNIDGRGSFGTSTQTFNSDLTNDGTITLLSDHGSYSANINLGSGGNQLLTNNGLITVAGSTSGTNTITANVTNTGIIKLSADDLTINNSGFTFDSRGGIIHIDRQLDVNGGLTRFDNLTKLHGTGQITLSGPHTLDIGETGYNHFANSPDLYFSGAVTVSGSGTLTNEATLNLRTTNDQFDVTIENSADGTIIINGVGSVGTSSQLFNAGLNNAGMLELRSDHGSYSANINLGSTQILTNSGTIQTIGSTSGTNNINGTIDNSGRIQTIDDSLVIQGGINNSGTLETLTGLTITVSGSDNVLDNQASGTITGTGILELSSGATFNNAGIITPGGLNSIGTLTINSDYTDTSSANLLIDVASTDSMDQLTINGNHTIAGALTLNFLNGFAPTDGQTFQLIQASNQNGTFDQINHNLLDNFSFTADYSNNQVLITTHVAAPVSWTKETDGNWEDSNAWSDSNAPFDDLNTVLINNNKVSYSTATGTSNLGSLQMGDNAHLEITGGTLNLNSTSYFDNTTTLTMNGGTLGGTGLVNIDGSFIFSEGTISNSKGISANGSVTLGSGSKVVDGQLRVAGGTMNATTMDGSGGFSNSGTLNIRAGNTSTINPAFVNLNDALINIGTSGTTTKLVVNNDFTNQGTIVMDDRDTYTRTVSITVQDDQQLLNRGTIRTEDTSGGGSNLQITGAVTNRGTLDIDHDLTIINSNQSFDGREGIIDVAEGKKLTINEGTTLFGSDTLLNGTGAVNLTGTHTLDLTNDHLFYSGTGASLRLGGNVTVNNGRFTIDNDATLTLVGDTINAALLNQGTLKINAGSSSNINADFINTDGATLDIGSSGSTSRVILAQGFDNRGTIILDDNDTYHRTVEINMGNNILNNIGTIQSEDSSGGGSDNSITASIRNRGDMDINSYLLIQNSDKIFDNRNGNLDIADGQTLEVSSGTTVLGNTTFSGGGSLKLSGTNTLELST